MDNVNNAFTYVAAATGLLAASTGTATTLATTVATANTANGTVWLNERDGSFVYTPASDFSGTDTFTYQAEDAVSTSASPSTTVTINVGGSIFVPQNLTTTGIGDTIVVPVQILSPDPANSGGLANLLLGINYDPSVFAVSSITEGPVIASWLSNFTVNSITPGQIIISTSDINAGPIISTVGGTLVNITFSVTGTPSSGSTSMINISGAVPSVSALDTAGTIAGSGNALVLPLIVPLLDNTNFNSPPGATDGLVTFPSNATPTATTVAAVVGGNSAATFTYGSPVTLTATVAPLSGASAPPRPAPWISRMERLTWESPRPRRFPA